MNEKKEGEDSNIQENDKKMDKLLSYIIERIH
jgi:hypothetical protein